MFRFRVRLQNPKCGYQYRNLDYPIKRNPRVCAWRSKIADCWWRWSIFFFRSDGSCTYAFNGQDFELIIFGNVSAVQWLIQGGSQGLDDFLPPPSPPPYLKVFHCCMYYYVFKLLSEPYFKLNCWYSLFKVRLRHGFMKFFGDVPGLI